MRNLHSCLLNALANEEYQLCMMYVCMYFVFDLSGKQFSHSNQYSDVFLRI